MSRLGKTPLKLPSGVEVKVVGSTATVKGPKGSMDLQLPQEITLEIAEGQVLVNMDEKLATNKAVHGLYRSLMNNSIVGVTAGFEKKLTLIGVGYRAAVKGNNVDLQLGFSHPNQLPIPEGVTVKVDGNVDITISGIDRQKVGQFAADIRSIRPPEPYKGKGVRYVDEYVRKKAGKAAKGK